MAEYGLLITAEYASLTDEELDSVVGVIHHGQMLGHLRSSESALNQECQLLT